MSDLFYVQDSRQHVGNSILWWGKGGNGYVTSLDRAQTYTKAQAVAMNAARPTDVPWPKDYVDGKAAPTVDAQYAKLADALAGTGITLEPKGPTDAQANRARCRCFGCGRLMSEAAFWGGSCAHCGVDSRP